jgi:hypothetical protein
MGLPIRWAKSPEEKAEQRILSSSSMIINFNQSLLDWIRFA